MNKFQYLMLGYALIWFVLGVYMITLGRRMKRLSEFIQELRDRLESRASRES